MVNWVDVWVEYFVSLTVCFSFNLVASEFGTRVSGPTVQCKESGTIICQAISTRFLRENQISGPTRAQDQSILMTAAGAVHFARHITTTRKIEIRNRDRIFTEWNTVSITD